MWGTPHRSRSTSTGQESPGIRTSPSTGGREARDSSSNILAQSFTSCLLLGRNARPPATYRSVGWRDNLRADPGGLRAAELTCGDSASPPAKGSGGEDDGATAL